MDVWSQITKNFVFKKKHFLVFINMVINNGRSTLLPTKDNQPFGFISSGLFRTTKHISTYLFFYCTWPVIIIIKITNN